MPRKVAVLTATCMLAGSPDERADSFEHRLQMQTWQPACQAVGIDLCDVVWNDASWDPAQFDAVVLATPWDYQEQPEAFLARLAEIEAQTLLCNSLECVRWNLDKRYLRELEQHGARIVPTLWTERADQSALDQARARWPESALVVKPQIGAGGWRQVKVGVGEALPDADQLPPGRAMIQPFLPTAVTEGEVSLIFCGGQFSHALRKMPAPGDYRVQALFGGREQAIQASTNMQRVAETILSAVPFELLYARIDLMRDLQGEYAAMELELIEPYLYPEQGPQFGERWASALRERLDSI